MTEAEIPLEDDDQEIVTWFDRPPLHLSPVELSVAVGGAFLLGALATVGALALTGHLRD